MRTIRRRTRVYLAWFVLHFALILIVCCRDAISNLATSKKFSPIVESFWQHAVDIAAAALGEGLEASNPVRQALSAYTHSAGIEGGYGFFAPNVPNSYKLVFELHHADGRVDYVLPRVGGAATGLRLNSLFDAIGQTRYDPLRQMMLKMLAYSVWREHSDVSVIRAVFGIVNLPTAQEFKAGKEESYEFLYAYDFTFHPPLADPNEH